MADEKKFAQGVFFGALLAVLVLLLAVWLRPQPTTTATLTDRPRYIIVRGREWQVVTNDASDKFMDEHDMSGATDCKQNAIFIHSNQNASEARDDLIHELLHAGTCDSDTGDVNNLYWNSTTQDKHEGIYNLASYLSSLFYDNPDLVKYLAGQ